MITYDREGETYVTTKYRPRPSVKYFVLIFFGTGSKYIFAKFNFKLSLSYCSLVWQINCYNGLTDRRIVQWEQNTVTNEAVSYTHLISS